MYDLLLINAHRQYDATSTIHCDWLGIYHLATFLEQSGYPARAFAGFAHEVEKLLEVEIPLGVKVLGFSCDFENQAEVLQFCQLVRERWALPVIVGGPQAVALGESFLQESGALAVVHGEGELPLLALVQHLVDGNGSLEDISGITFLKNGTAVRTSPQAPISNLDALPFIDPSLVLGKNFRQSTATFLTARGCPFRCAFCYEGGNTRNVRWRSVESIMAELRQALTQNPHIRYVLFTDDTFTLRTDRIRAFAAALSEYRKERDFGWFAEAHPQTILKHPEIIPLMISAGLVTLQIGVESGSERTLRAYNKKTTPAMLEEVVRICRDAGLAYMVGNIIVGGAFDSEENIAQSQAFGLHLLELGAGMLELHAIHFWPLPNTAMTTRPQDFGMEILDPQSLTAVTDYPVVRCGTLGPERLSQLRADMDAAFDAKMAQLAERLSMEGVLRIMHPWQSYKIHTGWVDVVSRKPRYRRFASLYFSGAIRRADEIPVEEVAHWHPQRLCTPITRDGRYFADDLPIDTEAYQVLVASAGRMTVEQAATFCAMPQARFLDLAYGLELKMALAFCRY